MSELLDMLLRPELPDLKTELPTKQVEVKRLSRLLGEKAVFTLHGLPYGRVQELRRMEEDGEIHILLAGCDALRDSALCKRYGAATPDDAVKRLLLPGEVAELSQTVERLCGFRMRTIREVKND